MDFVDPRDVALLREYFAHAEIFVDQGRIVVVDKDAIFIRHRLPLLTKAKIVIRQP